jgi:iron complex outermembrane receptor protein
MPGATIRAAVRCALAIGLAATAAPAIASAVPELKDLERLSLEELANVVVTSVSRRAERLSDVAASAFVITSEDIRRSGATSLPEVLRLAPNLQVARADANQYAITARGFNNTLANKLLVMIDGRTVYSPLFSGVFWEAQHVMLEDVERIEVISGPGATQWGANAVNGVINVITKRAMDTQGTLVTAGGGTHEWAGAVRHGGRAGADGHYRVYGMGFQRNNSRLETGAPLMDGSETGQAGFRVGFGTGASMFTIQGDVYRQDIEQPVGGSRDLAGTNLVARWTKSGGDGSHLHLQAYYDRTERTQPGSIREMLDTYDVELHYGFNASRAHRLLVGAGYRHRRDDLENLTPAFSFIPASRDLHRGYVFVQDEIALASNLALTLGLKFEHNNYTDWETLPSARLGWRFMPNHLLWTALSRAVRAPSRIDREFFVPPSLPPAPPFPGLVGGPNFESEVVNVFEVGYRAQPRPALSYSVSVFYNDYEKLRSIETTPAGLVFANRMEGSARGVEAWGSYRVTQDWRLTAGGTYLKQDLGFEPGSAGFGGTASAGNDPRHWWQLGSSYNLTPRHEMDIRVRRVASLPSPIVESYTAVDARLGWKITRAAELSLSFQNLLDPAHPEWGAGPARAEVERAWFLKLALRI